MAEGSTGYNPEQSQGGGISEKGNGARDRNSQMQL